MEMLNIALQGKLFIRNIIEGRGMNRAKGMKGNAMNRIRNSVDAFLSQTAKVPEKYYLILLCFYIISNMIFMIGWKGHLSSAVWSTHVVLFSCVMWASAVYLFILADCTEAWKKTSLIIGIGLGVFLLTALLSRVMTSDSYAYIMGGFLCLMACGKEYRKLLHYYLIILISTLVISWILLQFGITFDAAKPNRVYGGHSLGILYPNNWGFLVFAVLVLLWYLFLQGKRLLTLVLFWAIALFMYKYITCLTVAGLAFAFPVVSEVVEFVQDKQIEKNQTDIKAKKSVSRYTVIAIPFLVFTVMMLLCWQMDWVHDKFYGTAFESMAMRFVEGGYTIRLNGLSLFGHPFEQWDVGITDYSREIEMIVDSAFTGYLIIRGVVWMLVVLSWLAYAHYLCLKRRDYRLIVISAFFLIFSMMERPGLDVWYNFVLLYPLADSSRCFIKQTGIAEQ